MAPQVESGEPGTSMYGEAAESQIMAHELPDRYVFTDTKNTDGWIATDVTIDVVE